MSQLLWKQLVLLTSCDQKIHSFDQQRSSHKTKISHLQQQNVELLKQKAVLQEQLQQGEVIIRITEGDIEQITLQENRLKKNSTQFTGSKEFSALKNERAALEKKYQKKEEELLRLWHESEGIKKKLHQLEEQLKSSEQEISAEQEKERDSISESMQEYEQLKNQRISLIATIPDEWKTQYESMKHKVNDPIVAVHNASCGSCFYPLLHQELAVLKRNAVVHCKSCYRFLYYDSTSQPEKKV